MMNALIPFPSTPRFKSTPTPAPAPAPPPSPGTWRHPRFAEIVSRRKASTFSEEDFRRAVVNSVGLFLSFTFGSQLHTTFHTFIHTLSSVVRRNPSSSTYTTYIVLILRLYLLLNLWFALRPLLRSRTNDDTISDIPLTPSQRALMGLPLSPSPAKRIPHGASPMPSSNTSSPAYVTPPRYKRTSFSSSSSPIGGSNPALMTSTPNSFRSVSANYSPTTPLSDRKGFTQADLSPFRSISPNTRRARSSSGSPLFQKAIVNNNRTDNGSPAFQTSFSPSSPSPIGLRRSQSVREGTEGKSRSRSPALNYKWLYEKEMRNPIAVAGGGLLPRSESIPF